MAIVDNSADEYVAFLKAENAKWGKMVKALKLKAN